MNTPQFQTALVRMLGDMFPDCTSIIREAGRGGLEFQLLDLAGQPRSNRVTINGATSTALTQSDLTSAIRRAGAPPGGFPPGL